MVQCDLSVQRLGSRTLMVFWSTLLGKKLFEVKFNGMVALRILHMVMIKVE